MHLDLLSIPQSGGNNVVPLAVKARAKQSLDNRQFRTSVFYFQESFFLVVWSEGYLSAVAQDFNRITSAAYEIPYSIDC